MSERRLIEIGVIPSGAELFYEGSVDPAAAVVAEGIRRADAALAQAERVRVAAIADAARVKNTRAAKARRRLKRALRLVGYGRSR